MDKRSSVGKGCAGGEERLPGAGRPAALPLSILGELWKAQRLEVGVTG